MKKKGFNLSKQLLCIGFITFSTLLLALSYFLPRVLLPVYENNLYTILQTSSMMHRQDSIQQYDTDIVFIYVNPDGTIVNSTNLEGILSKPLSAIIERVEFDEGNFLYDGKRYYYISNVSDDVQKIALTDSKYIDRIRRQIMDRISPLLFFVILISVGLSLAWARILVNKIEQIKEKIDNLNNENYDKKYKYVFEDEMVSLSNSIDEMKNFFKVQDEYKKEMYESISHDFKTPITVIKSYIEAMEDGIKNPEEGNVVIKKQISKLELRVQSLLYLNKLNYLKDREDLKNEITDVTLVIKDSVEKFKYKRTDVKWEVKLLDSKVDFNGSFDMWEAIIDNFFSNFVRYAKSNIRITVGNKKIIFYNDGPNIDSNLLNDIFSPYEKGIKGEFGLGLSIVKKTIDFLGYEITVQNEKNGISFIIK